MLWMGLSRCLGRGMNVLCARTSRGRFALRGRVAHNFAGETKLSEFIEMAAACRVFLTNDSGGMHIASALGVPTVAVFGATDDEATMDPPDRSPLLFASRWNAALVCCASVLSITGV